jgi:hypothetical protein
VKRIHTAIAILVLGSAALIAAPNAHAASAKKLPAHCDRACLVRVMNDYVAALTVDDPSLVPLAPNVEFVENSKVLHPGEGLWKTAESLPTAFAIYIPDPVSEQVGLLCVMRANNEPIEAGFRLKIRHGEIVAAEHLWDGGLSPAQLRNLQTPRAAFLETVPPRERNSRDEMLKIANTYYTALTSADANNAPFASDCQRHESGMQTTGNPPPAKLGFASTGAMGCAAQLKTHVMDYITRIEPRRIMIADPQTGLVFGFSQFRHPMKSRTEKIVGVPGLTSIVLPFKKPFDDIAAHVFKIYGGQIHQIEAVGIYVPYETPTGWENFPDHGR